MDLYYKIKEQRLKFVAPVDTIGCASMGQEYDEETRKFYVLVGLLFSSQTKDEITFEAVMNLTKQLNPLTPLNVLNSPREIIHECIKKVGYHNKKVDYLIEIAKLVKDKMPTEYTKVLKLPGIGKKMAVLYMYHACNKVEGISVDTHVHRISNILGIVQSKTPVETSKKLELMFDRSEWSDVNSVLVGFGQVICKSVSPKCKDCVIYNECEHRRTKELNKKKLDKK